MVNVTFLGYAIYGILKADMEDPELDNYTISVESLNDHYYYVAQGKSSFSLLNSHRHSMDR